MKASTRLFIPFLILTGSGLAGCFFSSTIPGVTHTSVIDEAITIAEERADFLFLLDPPLGLDRDEVIDWHNGLSFIVPNAPTTPIDSSYATLTWHFR